MSYKDQFDRVRRYLARIENQSRDRTEYEDDFWSFFQNCWHLAHWIENDPTLTASTKGNVWNDVKNSDTIIICRDLANRSKHVTFEPNYQTRMDAQVTQSQIGIEAGGSLQDENVSSARLSYGYTITLHKTGSHKDALRVARKAIKDWAALLKRNGLT